MSAQQAAPRARPTEQIQHYRADKFITAPFEILTDPMLTDGDRRMLLALCSFALGKSTLWPKRVTLAERAGIDISNVSKRVRRLVQLGWVTVQRRGHAPNVLRLHLPGRLTTPPPHDPEADDADLGYEWDDAVDYEDAEATRTQ